MGRITATVPDTPEPILTALREAYDKTMADPEFQAEAKASDMPLAPMSGDEVADAVGAFLAVDDDLQKLIEGALSQ